MRILLQIGVVLGVCLLGEAAAAVLPFPFPASVIALVLLFLLLRFTPLKPEHIREKSDFLLKNMAFFFIPAGVGVVQQYGLVRGKLFQLLFICAATTLITFAATALTVRLVMRLQARFAQKKGVRE